MKIRFVGSALALMLIATVTSIAVAPPADALRDGVSFGAYAAPVDGLTNQTAIEKLEQQLGTTLPVVRTFGKWDGAIGEDKKFHRWIRDGDRQMMVSIKPQRSNGEEVRWNAIANANPGSKIHSEMVALADGLKDFDDTVILGFHHEPEHKKNLGFGTSDEYRAAFRKLHEVFEQEGVSNVRFAWIMTAWSFEVGDIRPDDRRVADNWYPGDDVVDYISVQEYNWATCRDNNDTWESLEDGLEPFMRFARKHPSKQLILAEFGTPEGTNGQKADWFDDARALFKNGEYRDRFTAMLYFHHDDAPNGNPNCNWWLDSSTSAQAAAGRLANDSFYKAELGPLGQVTPPPANNGCTAVRRGDDVTLTWLDNGERPAVRRNGKWVTTLSRGTTSYVDRDAPAGATYLIRTNGRVDRACASADGDTGCSLTRDGNTVTLRWTDEGGRHIVRRNGSWLRTVGSNVDSYVDRNAPLNATYVIKTRGNGDVVDTTCR